MLKIIEIAYSTPPETFILEHYSSLKVFYGQNINLFFPGNPNIDSPPNQHGVNELYSEFNLTIAKRIKRRLRNIQLDDYLAELNYKLISKYKPDLIHFHFAWTAIKYAKLIERLKVKYTISLRGSDILLRPLDSMTYKEQLKSVLKKCQAIHMVSDNVYQHFNTFYNIDKPICIIPTVVNEKFKNFEKTFFNNKKHIICVGRLSWLKDFSSMVYAIKNISLKHNDVLLTIIGDGPEMNKLKYLVELFTLQNKVYLLGKKKPKELVDIFKKMGLFVLTSYSEGFPNVLVEAIYSGLPCLVPKHLNIQSVFSEDEIFFYDKFKTNDLDNMIVKILETKESELIDRIKKAQEKVFKNFNRSDHVIKFVEFYRLAVDNNS